MAKFLQETLRESGLRANAHILGSDAFKEFFLKVRYPLLFSVQSDRGISPSRYARQANHRQTKTL
jgi:hypothetical protein